MSAPRCIYSASRPVLSARCILRCSISQKAQFHESFSLGERTTRDNNKNRGVSAIHRRYPKDPLSVSKLPLPKPVDPEEMQPVIVDSDHGLYGFFRKDKAVLSTPQEDLQHGMSVSTYYSGSMSWNRGKADLMGGLSQAELGQFRNCDGKVGLTCTSCGGNV